MLQQLKEERLMVLNMLQEGKITADEATKLLDTLASTPALKKAKEFEFDEKINKFSQSLEELAKDFTSKVESTFKDVEPKLKKATKTVVEKTASIIDDVSKSINESIKNKEDNKIKEKLDIEIDIELDDLEELDSLDLSNGVKKDETEVKTETEENKQN